MNNTLKFYFRLFGDFNPEEHFTNEELDFIQFHLTHEEEKTGMRDEWGNWDIEFCKNDHSSPFIDNFVTKRLSDRKISPNVLWPDDKKFAVCLTHDVDRVESYSPKSFLRTLSKNFFVEKNFGNKCKLALNIIKTFLKKLIIPKKSDPIWNFEKWVELEQEFNFTSTYFFFIRPKGNKISLFDCDYILTDRFKFNNQLITVEEYIKALSKQNFEIGLHGSYYTYNDSILFDQQKKELERILRQKINLTRQHYLHFDIEKTPTVHAACKIDVDSSLGFNKANGFRAGTSFPYFLEKDSKLILEIPLILMDSAVYYNPNTSLTDAKKKVLEIINKVENVGGCLTINFHPDYVTISKYFKLYQFILSEISNRSCVVLSMGEIKNIIKSKCVE